MKAGIVLSGCGYLDGSEIHETVLLMLALEEKKFLYQGISLKKMQWDVINHYNKKKEKENRNILIESSRIMRGNIIDIKDANIMSYDAIIFSGGFGVTKNFTNFFMKKNYTVNNEILDFSKKAFNKNIPMGFLCISAILMPFIYPRGIKLTIGNDIELANLLEKKGAKHIASYPYEAVVDKKYQAVSTSAYMTGKTLSEIKLGINELVRNLFFFYIKQKNL